MLESTDPIKHISCNTFNFLTIRLDSANVLYTNYKLIVYKDFDTTFWDKQYCLCPYSYIGESHWKVKKVSWKSKESYILERTRIINEWIATSVASNINENKNDKKYLLIYESTEPSYFWDFLKNHHSLKFQRKVFTIDNGMEPYDFYVVTNIKRFSNFHKVWNSIEEFEKAVLDIVEKEEN